MIVTIDGPSGTGKSTVSRLVASRLGVPHLDTGAFYRAATLAVLRAGVELHDSVSVSGVVRSAGFAQEDGRMLLDGQDVSNLIRSPEVTSAVSAVSAHAAVRELLVELQRSWVGEHRGGAVVEGRDIGSVVFPDAPHKVYLDATPETRAFRRGYQEGNTAEAALADLVRRDRLDSTREVSPLTVPEGAVVIDTTSLSIEEVVDRVMEAIGAS